MLSILGSWDFISNSNEIILGALSKSMSFGLETRMEVTTKHYREVVMGVHGNLPVPEKPGFAIQELGFPLSQRILSFSYHWHSGL